MMGTERTNLKLLLNTDSRAADHGGSAGDRTGIAQTTPARIGLIRRIRREIAGGRYLTDDKLDIAIDRLADALCGYDDRDAPSVRAAV